MTRAPLSPDASGLPRAPAQRSQIQSFIVMDMMRAAAEREARGERVIHMEVGQPGTPAPASARAAAAHALEREALGYTLALGRMELRSRIAELYGEWYGLDVSPERIVATTGSSAGFLLAFLSLFDVGAKVALPQPGYPCYRQILAALGQVPVFLPTGPETGWMPTPEAVATAVRDHGIAGLLIASPANPTGSRLPPGRLAALAQTCRDLGIWLISDEIYHGLSYERPDETALAVSPHTIVINSFSKYFSMTGWRIGWMVVPEGLVRTIERLAQNFYISPPAVSQVAALAAFEGRDELEGNKRVYTQNRRLLRAALPEAGLTRLAPPDGAFYLYADVSDFTDDSLAFAKQMLAETGIAATPGLDFDAEHGRHTLRFSYAGTTADMEEAARRLAAWDRLAAARR